MRYEQGRVGPGDRLHTAGVSQWDLAHILRIKVKRSRKGLYIATGLPTAWCARLKLTCL